MVIIVAKEEFMKVIDRILDDMYVCGYSLEELNWLRCRLEESNGFCLPGDDTEHRIMVLEGRPEVANEVIARELSKIFGIYWIRLLRITKRRNSRGSNKPFKHIIPTN